MRAGRRSENLISRAQSARSCHWLADPSAATRRLEEPSAPGGVSFEHRVGPGGPSSVCRVQLPVPAGGNFVFSASDQDCRGVPCPAGQPTARGLFVRGDVDAHSQMSRALAARVGARQPAERCTRHRLRPGRRRRGGGRFFTRPAGASSVEPGRRAMASCCSRRALRHEVTAQRLRSGKAPERERQLRAGHLPVELRVDAHLPRAAAAVWAVSRSMIVPTPAW